MHFWLSRLAVLIVCYIVTFILNKPKKSGGTKNARKHV